MAPTGGFLTQGFGGAKGNFEVVFAWPGNALAHFWRANDEPGFPWYGPIHFGLDTCYIGATVLESEYRTFDRTAGNLEVLATAASGHIHHYWRENGGAYKWHGPLTISDGASAAPSMAMTGGSQLSIFYAAAPNRGTGFQYRERVNVAATHHWQQHGGAGSEHFSGVALALTTIGAADPYPLYKDCGLGSRLVAAVCQNGNIHLYMEGLVKAGLDWDWTDNAVIGSSVMKHLVGSFRGRPSVVHGSFGYADPPFLFGSARYGNLEMVVPAKSGGFMHFWRYCGRPMYNIEPIGAHWREPVHVAGPVYDEVSMIQSNFGAKHGNLEVVARNFGQMGFDFYWRDSKWHGPVKVGQ